MFDGRGMTGFNTDGQDSTSAPASRRAVSADPDGDRLMARIADGDRAAARQLMEQNLARIVGTARRMLGDAMEAEDVAQDVFLRVWKAAPRWQAGRARVSTWITRIAINLCHDRLRKRREVLTDTVPEQVDTSPDAEAGMARGETGDRIAEAMGLLPERQREAVEFVHFQEMSNIDAAAEMDISVEALESLLARGRRKLRSLLIGDAPELMASYTGGGANRPGVTS